MQQIWHTWTLRNRRAEISANVMPPMKTTRTRDRLPSATLNYVKCQNKGDYSTSFFFFISYTCTNGFWNYDLILHPILILSDIIVFENKTKVKIRGQLLQLWKSNVILLLILSAKSNVHLYRLIIVKRFVFTKEKMTQYKKVNKEES